MFFQRLADLRIDSDKTQQEIADLLKCKREVFDKCIETAFSIFDFENIKYLKEKYPEFAENCAL